jgi:NAD+ synthase (glutamine-hydrolysing)
VQRAPPFKEQLYAVDVDLIDGKAVPRPGHIEPELSEEASVYGALVLGVRDYVTKHRFPGIVLGLSGGIDSALTLAIAVDALGADRVRAVMMPSRYTSQMSLDDAAEQARTLGVGYDVISIEGMFEASLGALQEVFAGRAPDTTEENIPPRALASSATAQALHGAWVRRISVCRGAWPSSRTDAASKSWLWIARS